MRRTLRANIWSPLTQMEARAAGCKVISYRGNEYSDYWIHEGSQYNMAMEILNIINGMVEPRMKTENIPDISETAQAMKEIYETII